MRRAVPAFWALFFSATALLASPPKACPGSSAIGKFQMLVEPPKSGPRLPLSALDLLDPGDRLGYLPGSASGWGKKARVAVVLVPSDAGTGRRVTVLKVARATAETWWNVPFRTAVVGMVVGPRGLSVKKVNSFIRKNPDLMPQMAGYAQRASTVEALVQTLSKYEQSKPGATSLQSALGRFSAEYGVSLPSLDPHQSSSAQASTLLQALLPALSSTGSLTSGKTLLNGSTGLAASVASLFLGSPVGLASGGAVLFGDLQRSLFPRTDFRAAFAQPMDGEAMVLCGNGKPAESGTRIAYLWVERLPDVPAPRVALAEPERLPLGWTSSVRVTTASVAELGQLPRARDWRLLREKASVPIPVTVQAGSASDRLTLDLRHAQLAAGAYHLAAEWDWTPLPVSGTVTLVSIPALTGAAMAPESGDRLLEGNGTQWVHLVGADFEFVAHAELVSEAHPDAAPTALAFTLPKTKAPMPLESLDVRVDCNALAPGAYRLRLVQHNGSARALPLVIHPPDPRLTDLPLRLNLGEGQQKAVLRGTGLNRIARISSSEAVWKLAPVAAGASELATRAATIALAPGAKQGDRISARVYVDGLHQPLAWADAIVVIGPRPKIVSVRRSSAAPGGVELLPGEIAAETAVSFLIEAEHAGPRPLLDLFCGESGDAPPALVLAAGTRRGALAFDSTGGGTFFLSLDPQDVDPSGCLLTAALANRETGTSAPVPLGRVVLLPQIDKFTLSAKRAGPRLYEGTLTGRDLQLIEKTGWDEKTGFGTLGIPTPVPGDPREQTLEIAMPWPPPTPQAPLYLWLQGETRGRRSTAVY